MNSFLGNNHEKGTIRELFFLQSLDNAGNKILASDYADFQINNILFEIGGKNKTASQLRKVKLPAFLVKDDILIGNTHSIPLLYFGFCY